MILWIKGHLTWIVIVVLIVSCGIFLFSWVDALVTIDNVSSERERQRGMANVLRSLLQETGKDTSRTEITKFVREHYSDNTMHVIKEENNRLSVDGIILIFNGQNISEVKFIDEE
jgi:Na+-transporting NADH:ubiquinone oxidoreductase subunit NqrC